MMRFWLGLAVLLTACQTQPTRVYERQAREFEIVTSKHGRPLVLTEETLVFDARPAFDYGLSRVTGSYHLPWENLTEKAETGELMRDRRKLAQRLAMFGLTPSRPVIAVGRGPAGEAEEGRLAWTLLHLGFRDVQTAAVEVFRKNMTQLASPAAKNAEPVELEPDIAMVVGKDEFLRLSQMPKERLADRIWIVDVRSEAEYFNKNPKVKRQPDIGALHIEWKQFYTRLGRPDPEIRKRLQSLGVRPEDRIVLVSNRGVRSSAAAYALIALGFSRAENFLSGYRSL